MNSELNSETVKLLREYRSVAAMAEHNGVPVQDRVHASARIFGDHLSMVEPALAAAWLRREAKRVEA
ncbi:MAG: hypothetical protein KKD08_01085, partial [Alphaproteobacteria bacterium]|nr:hypothetical protein [Alphaproteobacteria bacterium]